MSQLDTQPETVTRPAEVDRTRCPVCGSAETAFVADLPGAVVRRTFHLRRCPGCAFGFIANPCTDYAKLYDETYYRSRGADPLVDYVYELEHPDQTIRQFEWRGVVGRVRSLVPLTPQTRWLDFGCGNGGLVRYARAAAGCDVVGTDIGWITTEAIRHGIPILSESELDAADGTFDVVTSLEVLEHVPDPHAVLARVRRLLKPGGLFFYTTGNAAPYRADLARWPYAYAVPDLHVSFFEPGTMKRLLEQAGFVTRPGTYGPGCADILRFKVLKNLRIRRHSAWQSAVPWGAVGRLLNRQRKVFDHPIAWAK